MATETFQAPFDVLGYALAYARLGLPVLPVNGVIDGRCQCGKIDCRNIGKHPATQHGLKDASTRAIQFMLGGRP